MPSCRPILSKDKQFFVHPPHFSIVQPSRHQPINRKHVEAYHIRPQHGRNCMLNDDDVFVVIISFSPTSGRMRYAPTPVRLKTMLCWFAHWFRFRSREGVCDTPLHLFVYFTGYIGLCVGSVFAHMRAYAIRPYTYSIENIALLVGVLVSFPST